MEARNRTLPEWFARIRSRQISLPRFQRHEAWTYQQVTGLLNTVLQGLPAGAVLVLEIGDEEPFISRPMKGAPSTGDRIVEQLLDGQQRLTALWRSLNNDYRHRSFFVSLNRNEETGAEAEVISKSRWEKDGRRYPVWLNSATQLWANRLVPVELLRPDSEGESALKAWAKDAAGGKTDDIIEIHEQVTRLRQIFASFNLPFLSLPRETSKETALNVFIQMNTSATPLSAYDIVVAQVEAGAGRSLHEMVDELKSEVPHVESYIGAADLMLAVSALLQDQVPNKSKYLDRDFSKGVIDQWERTRLGIKKAVAFLEEEKVFDDKRLPTDVVLYPLTALWALAPEGLDAEGETRTVLRKFLWRAFFTERYERSSATRALVDFRQLRSLFGRDFSETPIIFDDDEFPLPTVEELREARWPVRKDRLPRAILALSLRSSGLDFADGTPISREQLLKREYHHLFPRAWLTDSGVPEQEINRALNCALVTWKTNRNISAKAPAHYLEERLEGSSLGEAEIRRRLESHLIPYAPIVGNDYNAFIMQRAELVHQRMLELCR